MADIYLDNNATTAIDPHDYPSTGAPNTPVLDLAASYTVAMDYDSYFGRVKGITYPQNRFRLFQRYDIDGYASEGRDRRAARAVTCPDRAPRRAAR